MDSILQVIVQALLFLQVTIAQSVSDTKLGYIPCNSTKCKFTLWNDSIDYFQSKLKIEDPKLIKFHITLGNHSYNATPEVFEPISWVWTYNSSRGMYPYLYWNFDFGLLSFGLLEAKTLPGRPFIGMDVTPRNNDDACAVTFGTRDTTKGIACALEGLLTKDEMLKYQQSYFCFLAKKPGVQDSILYTAALYFMYPVDFINFNCCTTFYNFTAGRVMSACMGEQIEKWVQCTILPYTLGIILLLYVPILTFKIGDSLSEKVTVVTKEYELIGVENNLSDPMYLDANWIYLGEYSPYSIFDCLSQLWCGLDESHPILVSRTKRFTLLFLAPTPIFVQLLVYKYCWEPGLIQKFIKHGTPMGFLTLLGDESVRDRYFVPALGGGITILLAYAIIGLVIVVLPYNLKQMFEDGISRSSNTFNSPLCLGIWEIQDLSSIRITSNPGYGYCGDVCVSSIYMLFNSRFWVRAFAIQYNRFCSFLNLVSSNKALLYIMLFMIVPFYILFCMIEVCLCLVWYGIPFFRLLNFLSRGVIISLLAIKLNADGRPNKLSLFIRNPLVFCLISILLVSTSTFFTYTYCLIFIQSFQFLSQVLMFCFVAVIVYPAIAFGYLFFFIMLLYYMFHLFRGFGDAYQQLLSDAVEVSRNLDVEINYTTTFGSTLEVSNVKAHGINQIKIEGKTVCLPHNFFQSIVNDTRRMPKVQLRDNTYGIPRKLFHRLIKKYKPVNQQVLKIVIQLALITLLLAITMSITGGFVTGPTSEISDVMHVLFIVTIGALPRILEVAMATANESVKREIELRHFEQTIVRYWQKEEVESI